MGKEFQIQNAVAQAQELRYATDKAFDGYMVTNLETGEENVVPTVYRVEGFGVSTQIGSNDEDAWNSILNPEAHTHRVNMVKHNDPADDFEMTPREILESSLKASVSLGQMSKAEMKETLAAHDEAAKERAAAEAK